MDYSLATNTLSALSQLTLSGASVKQLYYHWCNYQNPVTGTYHWCDETADWQSVPIDGGSEEVLGANVAISGPTKVVVFHTATLAKAAICSNDCQKSDNWQSYVISDAGHFPLDTLMSGPLLIAAPDSATSRVFDTLLPTRINGTSTFKFGVGGMAEASTDP
jgi:hypothetical protein